MDSQITRYIHICHWDYWYNVHHISGQAANSVEFRITNDAEGKDQFFHLDLCNIPGMEQLLKQDDYIDQEDPSYPEFYRRMEALKQGNIPFLIGALFFPHYSPSVNICNQPLDEGKSLFEINTPSVPPYYADIFLQETRPLTPDVLLEWLQQLCPVLFHENFIFRMADMPSYEESLRSYREDRPI